MVEISLEEMKFYAYHGVLEQEQIVGNNFEVTLKLLADVRDSVFSDNLEDTINYAEIYQIVKDEMSIKSKLLEHLAGRINQRILNDYQKVKEVNIKISKLNPPFHSDLKTVSIQLSQKREE